VTSSINSSRGTDGELMPDESNTNSVQETRSKQRLQTFANFSGHVIKTKTIDNRISGSLPSCLKIDYDLYTLFTSLLILLRVSLSLYFATSLYLVVFCFMFVICLMIFKISC